MVDGTILYPPTRPDCDIAVLYIETSGCLPMCGHGTIGTVTMAIENGLVTPKTPSIVRLDTPAGLVVAEYTQKGAYVEEVRLTMVPSFVHSTGLTVTIPELGAINVDVAYGGNFYGIIERQDAFRDIADHSAAEFINWSPKIRAALNDKYDFTHPVNPEISGLSHILWTGAATRPEATARNAVFYGDKAIDRSPCGTGTSARMAHLAARGELSVGDTFVHESIINAIFKCRVESTSKVGDYDAIIPSVGGWAQQTGTSTITIDDRDPYAKGFTVR